MVKFTFRMFYPVLLLVVLFLIVWVEIIFPTPESNGKKWPLYVNLGDYPAYLKKGFDLKDIISDPGLAPEAWQLIKPSQERLIRVKDFDLPGSPKRAFLSPFRERDEEYTIIIPFTIDQYQLYQLNTNSFFQPGIYLASLGDNWEIFFNGIPVKSEMHRDAEGQILSHRAWRHIFFPLNRNLFMWGTNILAFRIVGEPNYASTGMFYGRPYYIDDYLTIEKDHNESFLIALCGIYIFVGIYHFLIFLNRPRDRYNLYYCFFSILTGFYLLLRTSTIYNFIPDTNITYRLEFGCIFMIFPLVDAFMENLNFGKVSLFNKIYGAFYFLFAIAQAGFSLSFGEDILYLWERFTIIYIVYIAGYTMLYAFCRSVYRKLKKTGKKLFFTVLMSTLFESHTGNIFIGAIVMSVSCIIDIIAAFSLNYSRINASQIGFLIFTLITTVVLARRFGNLFNQLDLINNALETTNANLEATVQERTRELEQQTQVAEAASRGKSAFLARMSHEIRTPLNAIIGLSEVELQDEIPLKTRANLEKIYSSGSSLLGIINDILDISKIEAGNFEITPVNYDIAGIINDTIQLNIVRIGSKPIEFKLKLENTIPQRLFGDELRIKQILNNLLSNAIKYTEKGEVVLEINWEQQEHTAWLHFKVRDTGKGIRKEELGKLFVEYTQLDTTINRKIEGTGLGLSITKGLVEMMGGNIKVESEYGAGSVFEVRLPQGIEDGTPIGKEIADQLESFRFYEDRSRRGNIIRSYMPYGKILVVDDVMMNLDVIKGLMMPYGIQVDTAVSGREAVELIRKESVHYDLVFMDHMMPEMDGMQATEIIRKEIGTEYARNVPIVVLTANAIAGNRELFLNSGFDDYISKPIDIKQLDMTLNKWVRDKQSVETLKKAEQEKQEQVQVQEKAEASNDTAGIDYQFLESIRGINLPTAKTLYGNNLAAYMPVIKSFVTHIPVLLNEMPALIEGALPEYAIKVHGIKGSCGTICAPEIAAMARDLETASKGGDVNFVRTHHGALEIAVQALTAELTAKIAEWKAVQPETIRKQKTAPDRELLQNLSVVSSEYRTNEIEKIVGELEQFRYETGEELVRWLREQADNFEYDAIHQRLEKFLAAPSEAIQPTP
ncbi:MAG: response regulator [Treponema sp.]|jgi:signal transduction histidine kinase/DNA-binding response OmpR family regulator/HPt (histidine-containing phosphotransfer) domain-containing protein|nr:response regulator [Treponema sp.]